MMRWVFAGAGSMASSLIGGLLQGGTPAEAIRVFDVNADALTAVKERFGVDAIESMDAVSGEDRVVIAVKPDTVQAVCKALAALPERPALVLSVAAGVTASAMLRWLPENTPVVRTMPNTPALLGLGATGLYANSACSTTDREAAEQLFKAAGIAVWVNTEADLDAVTALSGSGPAYFFYLIEHMVASAVKLGLDEKTATQLAIQTATGAAAMARDAGSSPASLRQQVTSKGGTTHAAITTFDQHDLSTTIYTAMQAAHDRARELGKEFGES